MYSSVLTKTSRDRLLGMAIAAALIAVMLVFGIAVYRDVDLTLYYENMPPAILEMMGIPVGADAAGLAFGSMYSFIGALTIAGIAISMGTGSIAGEEAEGTIGILLANPKSRTSVLVSKAVAMLAVVAFGSGLLAGAGYLLPTLLEVDLTGYHVGALTLHVAVNAVFYGMLAAAIGASTGRARLASGTAIGVMVVSYLGHGILPLVPGTETIVKFVPWYYFAGGSPNVNGVAWADLAVLAGASAALLGAAIAGINRRDLRSRSTGKSLLDWLREHPMTKRMADRIAGSTRVSGIAMKTASEHQGLLVVCAIVMFYITLMMGPLYSLMDEAILDLASQFPDVLVAMVGGADMSTLEGFLQAEIFSITGPVTFGVLAILIGARAISGEEEKKTMGVLLANPVTRSQIIREKSLALIGYAAALGVVTFLGTWVTVALSGSAIPIANIGATSLLLTLLGLVFGGLTLTVGAATGKTRLTSYAGAGAMVIAYFIWSFFPLSDRFSGWARISPFHYYLGSNPLVNGMNWGHAAVLMGAFVALVALSMPLFERRDVAA